MATLTFRFGNIFRLLEEALKFLPDKYKGQIKMQFPRDESIAVDTTEHREPSIDALNSMAQYVASAFNGIFNRRERALHKGQRSEKPTASEEQFIVASPTGKKGKKRQR